MVFINNPLRSHQPVSAYKSIKNNSDFRINGWKSEDFTHSWSINSPAVDIKLSSAEQLTAQPWRVNSSAVGIKLFRNG